MYNTIKPIFSLLTLVFNCSLLSAQFYLGTPGEEVNDTFVIYDPNTYVETVEISEPYKLYEFDTLDLIENLRSNDALIISVVDTIVMYDPQTYTETTSIEENITEIFNLMIGDHLFPIPAETEIVLSHEDARRILNATHKNLISFIPFKQASIEEIKMLYLTDEDKIFEMEEGKLHDLGEIESFIAELSIIINGEERVDQIILFHIN